MAALWSPTPLRPAARSSLASPPPPPPPAAMLGSVAAADAIREVRSVRRGAAAHGSGASRSGSLSSGAAQRRGRQFALTRASGAAPRRAPQLSERLSEAERQLDASGAAYAALQARPSGSPARRRACCLLGALTRAHHARAAQNDFAQQARSLVLRRVARLAAGARRPATRPRAFVR